MLLLALDTCDSKGSVALLRDDVVLASANHDTDEDYSTWLLPAVARVLQAAGSNLADVDAFGVASGPGSFTGVRIGLTTLKAWIEVYGKPAAPISRLRAIALVGSAGRRFVAAFANVRRGQVFGAVYRYGESSLERVGEEMVIAPGEFIRIAVEHACGERISWATPDIDGLLDTPEWRERQKLGDEPEIVSASLADTIARLAEVELAAGRAVGVLELDAKYVRRSDAEASWQDRPGRGG
jgi:tRNA threonylcarbamoyladenosine biosynthesis protein TsaB